MRVRPDQNERHDDDFDDEFDDDFDDDDAGLRASGRCVSSIRGGASRASGGGGGGGGRG